MKEPDFPVTITLTVDLADVKDILLVYQLLRNPDWEWAEIAQAKELPQILHSLIDIIDDHFEFAYWQQIWGEEYTEFMRQIIESRDALRPKKGMTSVAA